MDIEDIFQKVNLEKYEDFTKQFYIESLRNPDKSFVKISSSGVVWYSNCCVGGCS